MTKELNPVYDCRKSFYGKAIIETSSGAMILYSYDVPVALYDTRSGELTLGPKWAYSQTTLRHVKEFLKQQGLKAESKAQIRKDYIK